MKLKTHLMKNLNTKFLFFEINFSSLKNIIRASFFLFSLINVHAQDLPSDSLSYIEPVFIENSKEVKNTFISTRIINGHSVQTLEKGILEFRIEHKFGDFAGGEGGPNTLFGLDNATDIRFGFEYGISDNLMIGIGRSRGNGSPYRSLMDGFIKYRLLRQGKSNCPISASLLGTSSFTYMSKSVLENEITSYPKFVHRFAYCSQLNIARQFYKKVSISIMPTLIVRNYVKYNDQTILFSLGGAINYAFNSNLAVNIEFYPAVMESNIRREGFYNSFAFGLDWATFGHNFKLFLTNSTGFGETQFIPYTNTLWNKGQFRLGFCIGRKYVKE
jgi:hypothetical protein